MSRYCRSKKGGGKVLHSLLLQVSFNEAGLCFSSPFIQL